MKTCPDHPKNQKKGKLLFLI